MVVPSWVTIVIVPPIACISAWDRTWEGKYNNYLEDNCISTALTLILLHQQMFYFSIFQLFTPDASGVTRQKQIQPIIASGIVCCDNKFLTTNWCPVLFLTYSKHLCYFWHKVQMDLQHSLSRVHCWGCCGATRQQRSRLVQTQCKSSLTCCVPSWDMRATWCCPMTSDPDTCSDPESSSTTVGVYINPGSSMASEKGAISKLRLLVNQYHMVID